ncbi:hypothetical protein VD0002_g7055 [Verticillium dahliae]|uniref:Uncharacterized protein n=1 Tax=Verticillium dahliae TaxID=27337 RepID=A0A444S552_VERDA|nr:Proline-specific permease [Verticillium dahliae VDG2]KAH6696297.1 hypothetical protein EV126DRAFT_345155 [Verticillium dahliae]PNH27618.1 hypothetical protein BJF96_g9078 [Verticillium dahliae]PNH60591.1 hypothetical protein VD0002_g7055 [Verticillium dahliae]RXG48523.1 hypothetical protein VDGE_10149 [Verticillium dahliae]
MTSPSQQNTNDETDSHDAVLDRAYLNGSPAIEEIENKHITSVEDHINSADVSVSGGSDTEASRGDSTSATKSTDGDKGHLRSSSTVKKPATFKAVSVNKKFLAASKSAPSNPAAKPSDKTNTASGLSAAPSSSSTLSASRPRLVAKSGAAGSVNKFSSSSNGGQAASGPDASAVWNKNRPVPPPEPRKFTDEELVKYGVHIANRLGPDTPQGQNNWADIDDDDDDWAPDTITWTDGTKVTLPAQPEEQAVQAPEPVPAPAIAKDKAQLIEPSKSPAPPETATSLPKSSGLPSGKGMILKPGSVEKPTFVAKPPAPASPAKSPWAKLPPVEKSSPAATESPFIHPSNHHRLSTRDGLQPSISPPPPAREIAADDFSRSAWREGGAAGNRELYNSQSGRYEPVGDRRGSFRADPHARHPAVMQRPHHDHPEPSAAFQTSRAAQEGSYGRRRGSSNLGNVPYSQRMHDQPPNARRPSFAVSIDGPVSPDSAHPPAGHAAALPHASPALAHAVPAQPAVPQRSVEEDLEIQKKVMRERLELARQRRRDEEAREEAEKQKRIKARLDAMGPAPERKSAKEASKEEGAHPAHILQQRQGSGDSDPATHPKESATASNTSTTTTATTPGTAFSTIDKSAADNSPKAVAEQPTAMKASVPPHLRSAENKSAGDNFVPPQLRDKSNNSGNPSWGSAAPSQPERFSTATWGPPPAPQAAGSVWAPNTRGLGNGTFNAAVGSPPVSQPGQLPPSQSKKGPAPIAPPSARRTHDSTAPVARPEHANLASNRSKWSSAIADNDRATLEHSRARQAEQDRHLAERGMTYADTQPEVVDNWRPSAKNTSQGSQADVTISRREPSHADRTPSAPLLPGGSPASQSRTSRFFPTRDIRLESAGPAEPGRSTSPSPPPPDMLGHPAFDGDALHPHVSLPRPQPVVRLPPSAAASNNGPRSGPQFSWANPAPYRDGAPPPPQGPRRPSNEWAHSRPGGGDHSHKSAGQTVWGDKFRDLFSDRKAPSARHPIISPPKASVVEPASKSAFDELGRPNPATVCLPQHTGQSIAQASQDAARGFASAKKRFRDSQRFLTTKPVSESCFEEQEMGSLPLIRMPREMPDAAWHPAPPPERPAPRRFNIIEITSAPQFWIPQDVGQGGPEYRIFLPGMNALKSVPAPALRSRSNPRRASGRGPRASAAPRGGGLKTRDSTSSDVPPPTATRGGRGSYRGRGSDWTRRGTPTHAA